MEYVSELVLKEFADEWDSLILTGNGASESRAMRVIEFLLRKVDQRVAVGGGYITEMYYTVPYFPHTFGKYLTHRFQQQKLKGKSVWELIFSIVKI